MPDDLRTTVIPDTITLASDHQRIEGVVIGTLVGIREGQPMIHHPGLDEDEQQLASAVRSLANDDIGAEIALVFVDADPKRPIVIGKLEHPSRPSPTETKTKRELVLEAERELTIRCGKSSIKLTHDGRLELRGKYLLSRASSVNRVRGGVIQLN